MSLVQPKLLGDGDPLQVVSVRNHTPHLLILSTASTSAPASSSVGYSLTCTTDKPSLKCPLQRRRQRLLRIRTSNPSPASLHKFISSMTSLGGLYVSNHIPHLLILSTASTSAPLSSSSDCSLTCTTRQLSPKCS